MPCRLTGSSSHRAAARPRSSTSRWSASCSRRARFAGDRAGLRRAPRRARHRRRGPGRPHARRPRTTSSAWPRRRPRRWAPRATSPTAGYCQEIFKVLQGARHRLLLLHRRQRLVGHGAHRQRGGAGQAGYDAALRPHPQDDRQRPAASTTTRPASRRRRASWRRPSSAPTSTTARCPASRSRVVMGRHAGFLTAASALARKFADDGPHLIYLPERDFVDRALPGRREGACTSASAAASSPSPRASTTRPARRSPTKLGKAGRARRARQRAALRQRRAGRPAVRRHQGAARHQARARRHLRLPAALLRRLRLRRRPARGARGRREGGAVRDVGRRETARSRSAAPASTRSTTS